MTDDTSRLTAGVANTRNDGARPWRAGVERGSASNNIFAICFPRMRMRSRLTTRKHFETCAARDVVRTYMHAQAHRHIPRTYVDSLCARPDTQTDTYAYTDTTSLRPGRWSKGTNTLSRVDAVQRATRRLASARASDAVTPDLDFARETCARVCPSGVGTVHSLTVARIVRRTKQTGRRNGCFLVRRGPSQPWTQYYTPAWHHHHHQHHTPARSILHLPCAMSPYGDCPPPRHELICPRDLTEVRDATSRADASSCYRFAMPTAIRKPGRAAATGPSFPLGRSVPAATAATGEAQTGSDSTRCVWAAPVPT